LPPSATMRAALELNSNDGVYQQLRKNGDDHVAYAKMILDRCGDDKDVEDIVEWGLHSICMDGGGDLRSEQEVFDRIDAIKSNFDEAREVAKDFPGFMPRFRMSMFGLNGGALPKGAIRRMAEVVEHADFSKIAKLNSFSCSGTILHAIDQLRHTAERIASVDNYKDGDFDATERNAYRQIVQTMAVLKAGPAAQARIKKAIYGRAGRQAAVILDRRRAYLGRDPDFALIFRRISGCLPQLCLDAHVRVINAHRRVE